MGTLTPASGSIGRRSLRNELIQETVLTQPELNSELQGPAPYETPHLTPHLTPPEGALNRVLQLDFPQVAFGEGSDSDPRAG